ncbi:hypothetical protein [Sphingopyxis sp.]|uniref:hypothetical protein n=1 Tax=Sphingopyxis sp. TaxID=1908224 RepID=UPI003BA8DB7F
MRKACLALLMTLAACSSPDTVAAPAKKRDAAAAPLTAASAPTSSPAKTAPALTLAPDGLVVDGRLVRFGIPRASAELVIGNVLGKQRNRGSSSECGAGTVDYTGYRDELQLAFQDGKFVGWTINGGESALKTTKGIGIGSPRQSVDAAYPDAIVDDSSLGLLFSTGDLVGIFDQDGIEGIVTDIWAGTVCLVD